MENDNLYLPEFIAYYPEIKDKKKISDFQTLLYGFIRFFCHDGREFRFTNTQLTKMFKKKSVDSVQQGLAKLEEVGLIERLTKTEGNSSTRSIKLLGLDKITEVVKPKKESKKITDEQKEVLINIRTNWNTIPELVSVMSRSETMTINLEKEFIKLREELEKECLKNKDYTGESKTVRILLTEGLNNFISFLKDLNSNGKTWSAKWGLATFIGQKNGIRKYL